MMEEPVVGLCEPIDGTQSQALAGCFSVATAKTAKAEDAGLRLLPQSVVIESLELWTG